ncbi:MAG: diguanylate cyclase [Proteobacteria bacterium]|nr:diguanylate cyclase [Pseudomonadota bacterium]
MKNSYSKAYAPIVNGAGPLEGLGRKMFALCPDAIIGINRAGIITIFNKAAEKLTGWKIEEAIGKLSITEIYGTLDTAHLVKKKLYSDEYGGSGYLEGFEVIGRNRDGIEIPVRLSAILLFKDEVEVGSVGFFHDLSKHRQLEDDLRKLSITDSLTGLYNRRHFYSVLQDEAGRSDRYGRPLTLIFLDLDNLKTFNDNFGHHEGDNILRFVSKCSQKTIRAQDYAFRQGGDEFALLLVETNLENGTRVAERFRRAFNNEWPVSMSHLKTRLNPVTISLGVAEHEKKESLDDLIRRADLAMYEAKKTGGDCFVKADCHAGQLLETKD